MGDQPEPASWRGIGAGALALAALLACPALAAGDAAVSAFQVGPVSPWVEILEPEYDAPPPAGKDERSAYHVLLDSQVDVRERGDEEFRHYAVRLVNDAGAEEYSQLNFYVDPAFQSLQVHWLRVYRAGRLSDRLAAAQVTVLPVESDLQDRIYRREQSVNYLVPDLRAGDVLDYAYSVDSVSPTFPRHYAARFSFGWSVPVLRQRIRVRHLTGDPVEYRVHGGQADPVVQERAGRREIEFEWRDRPALAGEADMPDSHAHWGYVEFSDMADWREVAAPTASMYRDASAAGPRMRAEMAKLKALPGDDSDRVLAALRMVQDEIRYASISIGAGSYRPHPGDVVLERNFGDCKDKSLLLVNLLRGIGVDASVSLVNTRTGEQLPRALPTPRAFDHAIVRVRTGDDVFWLDPTATHQGGSLTKTDRADYSHALVVDPSSAELEPMPKRPPDASVREVRLAFDLSAGFEKPATVEVRSRLAGRAADALRADMTDRSLAQRTTDYLNFYSGYYEGLKSASPIDVKDDAANNVVEMVERYTLERGFRRRGDGILVFELFPDELYDYADGTETPVRTAPLAQAYPAKVTQSFEIRLPEPWPVRSEEVKVENPAFRYRSTTRHSGETLSVVYSFESLSDRIPIENVPKYLADLKKMHDDLGYELTYDTQAGPASSGIAPYPLAAIILGLLAGTWIAMRATWRYDPAPREPANAATAPVGISGWLILVAFNVLAMCGAMAFLVFALATYAGADVWDGLPLVVGEAMAPWVQHAAAALLLLAFMFLPNIFATAVLFFRKRSSAPHLVIAIFWGGALLGMLTDQLVSRLAPDEADEGLPAQAVYAKDVLSVVIWTLYLKISERVAATFRERRPTGESATRYGPAPQAGQARSI